MSVSLGKCKAIAETPKALRVQTPDYEEIWLPKSQIDDDSEVWEMDDEGNLVISDWIAEQKGLV